MGSVAVRVTDALKGLALLGAGLLAASSVAVFAEATGAVANAHMPVDHAGVKELKSKSQPVFLRPSAESEAGVEAPEIYRTEDGATILGGRIEVEIPEGTGSGSVTYEFGVNLASGEYSARKISFVHSDSMSESDRESQTGRRAPQVMPEAGDIVTCSLGATITEKDPAYIPVASTTDTLVWERGPGHPPCADSSSGNCTPICPTGFFTCWLMNPAYNPRCKHYPATVPSNAPFESSQVAHYLNYDWPPWNPDNIPTFVEHYDTIRYESGQATVYWDAIESGQDSGNLWAQVTTTYNCY